MGRGKGNGNGKGIREWKEYRRGSVEMVLCRSKRGRVGKYMWMGNCVMGVVIGKGKGKGREWGKINGRGERRRGSN